MADNLPKGRADAKERAANAVVEYLDGIGQRKYANDVRSIIRSARNARITARNLARDNRSARNGAVWCIFCEAETPFAAAATCRKSECAARSHAQLWLKLGAAQ